MTNSNKPVWLLDIDGVINAVVVPNIFPKIFEADSWRYHKSKPGFPIHYSSTVIDFINAMSGVVDVRWHTTWQDEALLLAKEIGLNEFPVSESDYNAYREPYGWWKMGAAIRVVTKEQRPLIWTDDDITETEKTIFKEETAQIEHVKAVLIRPSWATGLNQEDLDAIKNFIQKVSDGSESL